jgi:ribosomal protein L7/L12
MAGKSLPPDVLDALRRGRTIEAIKRLRQATGLGLAEAKSLVDAHVRGDAAAPPVHVPHERRQKKDDGRVLPDAVMNALARGDTTGAVKLLRERTGLGLNEARKRIEAAAGSTSFPDNVPRVEAPRHDPVPESLLQPRAGGLAPGEVPQSNTGLWVILLAGAALAAYLLIG